MNNFFFFPVLRALNDGRVIRKCMSFLLYALAIITLLGGLYVIYNLVKVSFGEGATGSGELLAVIAILIFIATFLACAQVFWFRAGSIRDIPEGPFTVIPLVSVLLRALGEVFACLLLAAGIVGCLAIWITKSGFALPIAIPGIHMPYGTVDNVFVSGLVILIYGVLAAAGYLLAFVFMAEAMLVTVDIAVHVRMLVRQSPAPPSPPAPIGAPQQPPYVPPAPPQYNPPPPQPQYGTPPQQYAPPAPGYGAPQQQHPPYAPPQQQPQSTMQRCPTCGAEVPVGVPFCGRCGSTLIRK